MKCNTLVTTSLAAVGMLLSSTQAWSVSLTEPAGSYADFAISGTTVAARPELAGTVLEDMLTSFSFAGAGEAVSGVVQNRVIRSVDGTIDFAWRITIDDTSNGDISAFRVTGFDGFALDADWRIDGLGNVAPTTARYFGSAAGSVNFLFDTNEIGVRESSYFFFLDTEATNYALTGMYDMLCADSGCVSDSFATFAPSAVPVPAAVWLFGSGLVGLMGVARRKQLV